jgi:two-component system KDP operon response regulator KdpE
MGQRKLSLAGHVDGSRRSGRKMPRRFELGKLTVDLDLRSIRNGTTELHLTPTECRLLSTLAANRNRTVSPRTLVEAIWGQNAARGPYSLRVFVKNLRRKMEANPHCPNYLVTDIAAGYRLRF